MKKLVCLGTLALCCLVCVVAAMASGTGGKPGAGKTAIVLANFGTTVPAGVQSINNITAKVRQAYPQTEVRITFTSNIIRSVWKKRQAEAQKWLEQGVPEEVIYAKNIIATVGDLLEDGYTNIVVQPTHMFFMEQSYDLQQYVNGLASIETMKKRWKPIDKIVMGRPALGMPGDRYPYLADIEAVCKTLAADAQQAKETNAMLLYMGHGNETWSTGVYGETQKMMRELYPEVATFVGVVEGWPSLDDLKSHLAHGTTRRILLKPFMIVAGDHAVNDMAGPEADSWKSVLEKEGYQVETELVGLGSNDQFAAIFIDHIADVARDNDIELK